MENIKTFDVEFIENPFFENGLTLNDLVTRLNKNFTNDLTNFANRCYFINLVYSCMIGKVLEAKDKQFYSFNYLMQKLGFDAKSVSRHKNCYFKFCQNVGADTQNVDNFCQLKEQFKNFSPSKLFELLVLSDAQIENDIKQKKLTADMTFKEIREYVKSLNQGSKKANKVLEENDLELDEELTTEASKTTNYVINFEPALFEDLRKFLKKEKQDFHTFVNEAVTIHLKKIKQDKLKLVN